MRQYGGRFLFILFSLFLIAPQAQAQNGDAPITYTVKRGDTLIGFARQYLVSQKAYRTIQRDNRIRNPRFMPVGKTLKIRRNLLKYKAANARVLSVRGNVTVTKGRKPAKATNGQVVVEGSRLTTASSSFITLGLTDGSRISLPSNSDVRVRRLRVYILGGSLDYDFDILKGGTRSKVVPHKSKDDRYRVRTPKAVSAVRGTDFQARYDPNSKSDFAEVVEGALAVGTGGGNVEALPAGKGLALAANGDVTTESLLPAPTLIEPGKMQVNPKLRFAADPAAKEKGYRFTLSTDAGFVDQLADIVTKKPVAVLDGSDNGNFFIRARAISASGIQGTPNTYAFKRRLNGVKGSAGAGDDGYGFKWLSQGSGQKQFHFQLFKGKPEGLAIVDETGLKSEQVSISGLPPGDYYWRVGSVQYLDNEVTTNWTGFEKLSVAP